jgi:hypothetical protein
VDARLDKYMAYRDYTYNNSYTPHRLLKLMEADGLGEIGRNGWADAGDFYKAGDVLSSTSKPSSFAYSSTTKAVVVRDISATGPTMSLFASTDWAPPFTSVSGAPRGWTRSPVTLTFQPADSVSGVAATLYRVNPGAWTPGLQFSLAAHRSTHADDGVHAVAYRSRDNAGNVEATRRVTVRIDTGRPVCKAPVAAAVRYGWMVTLEYVVNDALSPRADVTIKVRRRDGTSIKTVRATGVTTGVRHGRSFACRLPRGTYRFEVSAVDLAGNTQTSIASNILRVR